MESVLSKLVGRVRAVKRAVRSSCNSPSATRVSQPQLYWSEARRIHSDPAVEFEEAEREDVHCQQPCLAGEEYWEDEDDSVFLSSWEQPPVSSGAFLFDWEEWKIPMEEISLRSIISCSELETIYSGYWHGNVEVHTRRVNKVEDIHSFLHEVTTLGRIRHENIQLFMGASMDLSRDTLAIVMSELKGCTLHARLHTYGHAFTVSSKTKILKQISEGMAYLHARSIPHGHLTSQSITLHSRVCISLAPQTSHFRDREFPPHHLTYLPPEAVRELCVSTPHSLCSCSSVTGPCTLQGSNSSRVTSRVFLRRRPTYKADVFAFGTIIYELMTLSHPYKSLPVECLVWKIGKCETQPLNLVQKGRFRAIISKCWSGSVTSRPSFMELLTTLEQSNTSSDVGGMSLKRSLSLPSVHAKE